MSKKILIIILIILIIITVIIGGLVFWSYKYYKNLESSSVSKDLTVEKKVALDTFEVANLYADAQLKTDALFKVRPSQISFFEWKKQSDNVLSLWENLEQKTADLDKLASVEGKKNDSGLIPKVYAYNAEDITAIANGAPPMGRVKAIANFLNVDAKRAFQILKTSQSQMESSAWNEEGDTMEKLENGAKLVKNVCKTGLYVGGIAMGGGATKLGEVGLETISAGIAEMGLLEQGVLIVNGADLLLEVGDDTANIALGYNNDASAMIGGVRKFTGPLAAISGLLTAPTETGYDMFNFMMMGGDQLNSMFQNNEILGISLPEKRGETAQVVPLKISETSQWLKDNNISLEPVPPVEIVRKNLQQIKDIGIGADFKMPEIKKEEKKKDVGMLTPEELSGSWCAEEFFNIDESQPHYEYKCFVFDDLGKYKVKVATKENPGRLMFGGEYKINEKGVNVVEDSGHNAVLLYKDGKLWSTREIRKMREGVHDTPYEKNRLFR